MNRSILSFFTLISVLLPITLFAADFRSGEEVTIQEEKDDDLYISGGTITVNAPVVGDLVCAGGDLYINEKIHEDLIAAGGNIRVTGDVGDDIRVSGGEVRIGGHVGGDLIIFSGNAILEKGTEIEGDLLIFGGDLKISGNVRGDASINGGTITLLGTLEGKSKIKGGTVILSGHLNGGTEIAAQKIEMKDEASIGQELRYWHSKGESDLSEYLTGNGKAIFTPELEPEAGGDLSFGEFMLGVTIFWIVYVLSVALLLFILTYFFTRVMKRSGIALDHKVKSLGYGALYFIGIPLAVILMFLILIGAPIGLLLTVVYIFSILFAHILSAVVITNWIDFKYNKAWKRVHLFLVSLLVFIVLKGIALIPIIGWLVSIVLVFACFGAMLLSRRTRFTNPRLRI